jgi:hypothetical protein
MNILLIVSSRGRKTYASVMGIGVRTKNTPGMNLSIRKPEAVLLKMPFEGVRNDASWLTYNGFESIIVSKIPVILV